ncbi:tyrosine--tRNA ligase [Patescibacteria group bacterium]|nr:tyrosine--tRNA ligase [Patescibacteria group bacterium]
MNKIQEVLNRGVENVYPDKQSLEKVLMSGKKIRLYCGFDPTALSLHIGHAITLRKLAQFQKLGHEVIFLIGDFTAMIGDPTDKVSARKKLTKEQVNKNFKNYKKQASKILKFSGKNAAKVMFNSKWNKKLSFMELVNLASHFTVQQMIARDMFKKRIKEDKLIFLPEFLYPLIQAYDSVTMDVDLEIGGNDQMFNMLRGRDLMKKLKNKEKFVLTTKLLVDSSGKKMGKTEGNIVNLDEEPNNMFGQIMAWPDSLILPGLELCTDLSLKEIKEIEKLGPRDSKARLAKEIVSIHHDKKTAEKAEKEFNRIFREKKKPTDILEIKVNKKINIIDLILKTKLIDSRSAASRLIDQNAIKIDDQIINDRKKEITPKKGAILQIGRKKFIKLI